jgi:hypothetical protein
MFLRSIREKQRACQTTAAASLLNSKAVGARRTCAVETVEVNVNSET